MAMKIRLARGGSKKRPFYRIVAADSRMPRDGRFIEKLGTYNPLLPKDSEDRVKMDIERVQYWLSQGAQPTDRVARMLEAAGVKKKKSATTPRRVTRQESQGARRRKPPRQPPQQKPQPPRPRQPPPKKRPANKLVSNPANRRAEAPVPAGTTGLNNRCAPLAGCAAFSFSRAV